MIDLQGAAAVAGHAGALGGDERIERDVCCNVRWAEPTRPRASTAQLSASQSLTWTSRGHNRSTVCTVTTSPWAKGPSELRNAAGWVNAAGAPAKAIIDPPERS